MVNELSEETINYLKGKDLTVKDLVTDKELMEEFDKLVNDVYADQSIKILGQTFLPATIARSSVLGRAAYMDAYHDYINDLTNINKLMPLGEYGLYVRL